MGGTGNISGTERFSIEGGTVRSRDENSYLSDMGHKRLCVALCEDIQAYKRLLHLAMNLDEGDVRESLSEVIEHCPDETYDIKNCAPPVDESWSKSLATSTNLIKNFIELLSLSSTKQPQPEAVSKKEARFDMSRYDGIRNAIDEDDEATRCRRYGFKYSGRSRNDRRRIFFGACIADDSHEVLRAVATEIHGMFDTVAFVEANETHTRSPRSVNYGYGGDGMDFLQSGMYGPMTRVTVDMYYGEPNGGKKISSMITQQLHREKIIDRWLLNGMTENDLGLLADADEIFSRDFLRALQICDVEQFKTPQSCRRPKIGGSTLIFQGSPECIIRRRRCPKPDIMIGYCIEGIGNSTGRLVVEREYKHTRGRRSDLKKKYPKNVTNVPLHNAGDFRSYYEGSMAIRMVADAYGPRTHRANGYHFHNFFDDAATIRRKYSTYGEAVRGAMNAQLEEIHSAIGLMVRCATGFKDNPQGKGRLNTQAEEGGFASMVGPMPIYYQFNDTRQRRQDKLRSLVLEDHESRGGRGSS